MTPHRARVLFALVTIAPVLDAQQALVRQPVLAWVFDSGSGAIRTIAGVSGAGLVDEPIPLGLTLEKALAAPSGPWALAESRDRAGTLLIHLVGQAPAVTNLEGAPAGVDAMAFSPSSRHAALYWASARRIQVWSGLPDAPRLGLELDYDDAVESLALADDGRAVVVGAGRTLVAISQTGARTPLLDVAWSSFGFRPGSRELAVADFEGNRVLLLPDLIPGMEYAAREFAVERPAAAAFSGDGRRLAVTSPSTESIALIDLPTGGQEVLVCDCRPDGLFRMQGNFVFRLKNSLKGPIWILDSDHGEPRITSVSGIRAANSGGLQ